MKIKEIIYSNNNDFKAVFFCPICKHEFTAWGYSDKYFYQDVLPNAICPKCNKNEQGVGRTYRI